MIHGMTARTRSVMVTKTLDVILQCSLIWHSYDGSHLWWLDLQGLDLRPCCSLYPTVSFIAHG